MIRKILLSLLLVATGLGVLHLLIGFENFANVDTGPDDQPIRRTRDERGIGGGIRIGSGSGDEPAVSVTGSGRVEISRTVERELPGGDRIFLPVYELVAEDSETVAEDLVRLDRVVVRLHRIEEGEDPPRAVHVGTIEAEQAFVLLLRDEEGNPSIRQDRDMDLRMVVLKSTPQARVRGLHLEVARLRTRQTDDGIGFHTPSPDQFFSLTLGGDQPASLSGRGVSGILPARRPSRDAQLELHVESRPVLQRGGTTVHARGTLDYTENAETGVGRIEIRDDVEVVGLPGGAAGSQTTAHGDLLIGRLVRFRADGGRRSDAEGGDQGASWRDLRLEGKPARLSSQGLELSCATLRVLPAFDGEPGAFVAEGSPELIEAGSGLRFEAAERIYVVDLPRFLGSIHAGTGYPRPYFGRLMGRLITFEGRSTVHDPVRGMDIEAGSGLRVVRANDEEGPSSIDGYGVTTLRGEGLRVDGSDGFMLRQVGTRRVVRLGPEEPDPEHSFVVERNLPDGIVRMTGHGACTFRDEADGTTRIDLESPAGDVVLQRGPDELRGVRELRARLTKTGALASVRADGDACEIRTVIGIDADGNPELVRGVARVIRSDDGKSFLLTGAPGLPASIDRGSQGMVTGERIEVHRVGAQRAMVIAYGAPAVAKVQAKTRDGVQDLELRGSRLRLLPGLIPPRVMRIHGLSSIPAPSVVSDQVFAEGDVEVLVFGADGTPTTIAKGQELVLLTDAGAVRLRGRGATVTTTTEDGRRLVARAREIRLRGTDAATQHVTLLPVDGVGPELDMRSDSGHPAFRAIRVMCSVPIVADGDDVSIDGRVQVRGLDDEGAIDPEGISLDASQARMQWSRERGEISRVVARGDARGQARLRYRGISAFGDVLRIDALEAVFEVESLSDQPAGIEIRSFRVTGGLFEVDYDNEQIRAWGPALHGTGRSQ